MRNALKTLLALSALVALFIGPLWYLTTSLGL